MPERRPKMICPECGAEMNHHAEKMVDPLTPEDMAHVDPVLGGVIQEVHTCPKCGGSASRSAR